MTISYVTETAIGMASGSIAGGQNNPTITLPSNQSGDMMILLFSTTHSGSYHYLLPPSGWTKLSILNDRYYTSNPYSWHLCWKRSTGSESTAAFSWSDGSSGSNYWLASICRVYRSPVGIRNPVYAENCSLFEQPSVTSWAAPNVTTTRRGMLVSTFAGGMSSSSSATPPSGFSNLTIAQDSSAFVNAMMADKQQTTLTDGGGTWSFGNTQLGPTAGTIGLAEYGGGQQQIL